MQALTVHREKKRKKETVVETLSNYAAVAFVGITNFTAW